MQSTPQEGLALEIFKTVCYPGMEYWVVHDPDLRNVAFAPRGSTVRLTDADQPRVVYLRREDFSHTMGVVIDEGKRQTELFGTKVPYRVFVAEDVHDVERRFLVAGARDNRRDEVEFLLPDDHNIDTLLQRNDLYTYQVYYTSKYPYQYAVPMTEEV